MFKNLMVESDFYPFLQDNRDKLVLVKFFTTWCFPCRELQKKLTRLVMEQPNLVVLEVDAEKFPSLTQSSAFEVRSVPVLFLFQQGKMTKQVRGNIDFQQLKEFINV